MINCPNKNSEEYKRLVSIRGEAMTHYLWNKYEGNVPKKEYSNQSDLKVLENSPSEFKAKLEKDLYAVNGFIKPQSYTYLHNNISNYNLLKGYKALSFATTTNGNYYIKLNRKGSIVEPDILVKKTELNIQDSTRNSSPTNSAANKLGINNSFRENFSKINFILGKILNDESSQSSTKFMAHWLKKLPNDFKNVEIIMVSGLIDTYREQARIGNKEDGTISIQIDSNISKDALIRTILHELLHNISSNVIDNPKTAEQKRIVKALTYLRETSKKYYEQLHGEKLTVDNLKKLYDTNRPMYNKLRPLYGLVNNHEFISEIFTNGNFQRILSLDQFDKDKSFFDRLLEILKDLLNTINVLKLTDTNSKHLEYALGESIKLIDNITNTSIETIESLNNIFPSLVDEEENNLTNRQLISEYLKKLIKRKDKLEEDLRKEKKDFDRKKELTQTIKNIENQISSIKKNYDYISVIETAETNLNYVNDLFSKSNLTDSDIVEMQNFVALYKNVTQYLTDDLKNAEDTSIYDTFKALESRAKEYDEKLFNIISDYALGLYKDFYNKDTTKKDLFQVNSDINWAESNLLSAGRSGVKLLEMIETLNKLTANKATEVRKELLIQEKTLKDSLKQNSVYQEKGDEIFYQKDVNNNWTGNRITKFKQVYWKEYWSNIYDKFNKDGKIVQKGINRLLHDKDLSGLKKFFDYYNSNHFLIDYNNFKDGKINEKYHKEILDIYGENETNKIIKQSLEKIQIYETEYEIEAYRLGNQYSAEIAAKYLKNWVINHSPYHFNDLIKGKTKDLPYQYNTTYVTSLPLKKHYDEQYEVFEQPENKALLDYAEFIDSIMNKQFSVIPDKELYNKKLSRNTLPILGKTIQERYAGDYSLSALANMSNEWIHEHLTHVQQSQIEDKDEYTQRPAFNFNLAGLSPITKPNPESGKLERDLNAQSQDLSKMMQYAINNYAIYKHKSEYENMHKLLTRAIDNIGINEMGININPNNLKNIKILAEFNEKVWFGKHNEIGGNLDNKFYTKDEKQIKNQLEENIKESNNVLTKLSEIEQERELTIEEQAIKDEYTVRLQNLQSGLDKLGINRSLGKSGRSLLKYVQLKTMAWNIPSFFNELIFGAFSSWNFAVGRDIFTEKDWSFAFGKMLGQYRGKDKIKINKLLDKFRVHENNILEDSDPTNKITKGLYGLQEIAEKSSRTLTMISYLNSIKIQTKEGEKSLYDILDEKGDIDLSILNEEEKQKWSNISENNISELDRAAITMQDLFNKIHGNYDVDTPVLSKDKFIGLAMLQFRGWMAEAFANRFQKEQYNSKLGISTKGRYLTMDNVKAWKGIVNYMSKGIIFSEEEYNNLNDIDKSNIRKNAIELYALLTVTTAIYLMLKYNEDDEDDNMTLNYLSNVVMRLQSDLLFFINPNEIEKLNSRLIPATQLFNDINDINEAIYKSIQGEPLLKTGLYAGHARVIKEVAQALPISNQVYKNIFFMKKTLNEIK